MKKIRDIRGFQAVRSKRIVPGFSIRNLGTVFLFLLLLPYIITILFGNLAQQKSGFREEVNGRLSLAGTQVVNHTALGEEKLPLELYVADKLARCMDEGFEKEALKAQAVLIRTNLLMQGEKGGNIREISVYDEAYGIVGIGEGIWEAVMETAGVCLFFDGKPVYAAYFAVSSGATRDGEAILGPEYPYLKSVVCSNDFQADSFISSCCLDWEEFERNWDKLGADPEAKEKLESLKGVLTDTGDGLEEIRFYRDSAGYVLYVEYKDKLVSGEQFREAFHLASAAFHMSWSGGQLALTVRGEGHGFGMSRFGANERAKEGESYVDILNFFFQDVTITKIE